MVRLAQRGAKRHGLEPDGNRQDADGNGRGVQLVRVAQLRHALVDSEQTAEAEEHQRHHERPEVPFASMAERPILSRLTSGEAGAEQQQRLVAAVGDGVDGLGEHRGGTGEQETHELGDSDAEVGDQGGQDCLAASLMHG